MLELLTTCHRPACKSVKCLLEVHEVVEQITLVLYVRLYNDSAIEDLFYCDSGLV